MMTWFRQLATLRATHAYNGGIARDIDLAIPMETAAVLRKGRILCRSSGGILHFLYEANEGGEAVVSATGTTLRVGLVLTSSAFRNVTDPATLPAAGIAFWCNRAVPTRLDAMQARTLVGSSFVHALSGSTRPVTVTVEDAWARTVRTEIVTEEQGSSTISIDLAGIDAGPVTVRETNAAGAPRETHYLLHPEWLPASLIGVVEVAIDASFYTGAAPPAFEVSFAARSETLNYYVVALNHSDADLERMVVSDVGFADDGRPKIEFTRMEAGAFGPEQLPISALGVDPSARHLLFTSRTPVTRQEIARRRIQLARNGAVVIEHLPQPSAARADANFIIHVTKAR